MTAEAAVAVTTMEDDFVALLALDAELRGLFGSHQLDCSNSGTCDDYDRVMSGPHWLLAYEGSDRKWLMSPTKRISKDPFFRILKQRRIRFYTRIPAAVRSPAPRARCQADLCPTSTV